MGGEPAQRRADHQGNPPNVLGVSQLGGEPDQTSKAPFQDSGVFMRGFPPNKKTTRQRIKTVEDPTQPRHVNLIGDFELVVTEHRRV